MSTSELTTHIYNTKRINSAVYQPDHELLRITYTDNSTQILKMSAADYKQFQKGFQESLEQINAIPDCLLDPTKMVEALNPELTQAFSKQLEPLLNNLSIQINECVNSRVEVEMSEILTQFKANQQIISEQNEQIKNLSDKLSKVNDILDKLLYL